MRTIVVPLELTVRLVREGKVEESTLTRLCCKCLAAVLPLSLHGKFSPSL